MRRLLTLTLVGIGACGAPGSGAALGGGSATGRVAQALTISGYTANAEAVQPDGNGLLINVVPTDYGPVGNTHGVTPGICGIRHIRGFFGSQDAAFLRVNDTTGRYELYTRESLVSRPSGAWAVVLQAICVPISDFAQPTSPATWVNGPMQYSEAEDNTTDSDTTNYGQLCPWWGVEGGFSMTASGMGAAEGEPYVYCQHDDFGASRTMVRAIDGAGPIDTYAFCYDWSSNRSWTLDSALTFHNNSKTYTTVTPSSRFCFLEGIETNTNEQDVAGNIDAVIDHEVNPSTMQDVYYTTSTNVHARARCAAY